MKKHIEKQPIDDLFARKLGNASLSTSPDGFDRLQARMRYNKPVTKVVFWRNPSAQRYIAIAACLVMVCLFGWLYWPTEQVSSDIAQVAVKSAKPLRSSEAAGEMSSQAIENDTYVKSDRVNHNEQYLSRVEKKANSSDITPRPIGQAVKVSNVPADQHKPEDVERSEDVLAQTRAVDIKTKPQTIPVKDRIADGSSNSEQMAVVEDETKPIIKPSAERVLVVTIDEPATLIAARQAVKASADEKALATVNDKAETEAKTGGLWQQVKRIKEGELFARGDDKDNDERGLLSRAYSGLKNSLDKDKSIK